MNESSSRRISGGSSTRLRRRHPPGRERALAKPARNAMTSALQVLLLTHYYAPELGAPQTRLRETAAVLDRLGHTVRVLTGPPHYPDGVVRPGYSARRASIETIAGARK